ncbi:MAG: lipocalin family protein [Candidatus Staskawiczbacteria bacterium]|nr:lipocalin family protein [Candidatus Staskawiczbacteria bacterium]
MSNQKQISTLAGIAIIIASIIVFFGGVFTYQYFAVQKESTINPVKEKTFTQQEQSLIKNLLGSWEQKFNSAAPNDPSCNPDSYEIQFNADETYNSWLHCGPFESGTWSLNKDTLTLTEQGSLSYQQKITIKGDALNLSEDGDFKKVKDNP